MQLVSITSDFGTTDYYVAEVKAQILSQCKEASIIDVSHEIASYDIVQAAHFVDNVFRSFPEGSIHLVAVYNYYAENSRFIIFEREGHYFVGPDNGVFTLIFENLDAREVLVIDDKKHNLHSIASIFAHTVSAIHSGESLFDIGFLAPDINQKMGIMPVVTSNQIRATIIHIDHYENVVINLKKTQFEKLRNGRAFQLYYKQKDPITHISANYADVMIGDVLCLFNSAGYMEIAVNMGKASSLLNLKKNETIQINFSS